MEIKFGTTRTVLLIGGWAIKLPGCYGAGGEFKHFLLGLLANMQERAFSRTGWPELCPVVWCLWGGWLLIMRRAGPLSLDEYSLLDFESWSRTENYTVPVEDKLDSFGLLNGRIVAVDYGN